MKLFSAISTVIKHPASHLAQNSRSRLSRRTEETAQIVEQKYLEVAQEELTKKTSNLTVREQTSLSCWSPALNQVLEEPPAKFPQHLTFVAIVFSVVCGAWAWFGTIDEVSKAQGKLIPQGETYKIESVELGKVKHIAVEEGDKVKAGETLIELDTELAKQDVVRLKQTLEAYQNELRQKQASRGKLTLEAKISAEITSTELLAKQAVISLAQEKVDTLQALLAPQKSELQAYNLQLAELASLPTLTKENLGQLESEKMLRQQRLDKLIPLAQQGAISQEYIFQVKQSLRDTEKQIIQSQIQEVINNKEQIFQFHQAKGDLETNIINHQGELATALKEVKNLEIESMQKLTEGKRLQLEYQQKIKQLEFELAQIKSKIAETQNLLVGATTKLRQKSLKAPIDGVVLSLNLDNFGNVVQAGETVIEIASEKVPLVLSAFIPNQEAGFVKEGMPVQVKLDAYPYQYYGLISGIVTYLSPDAKSDPQLGEGYLVEVELERNYVMEKQKQVTFKAGQTATADIVIRRRRILDIWLEPIKKLQNDGIEI
ncbi:MAG: HlyD family efflux transporter periplasmic adaptor subunit [Cyanobacteria bacterium P01_G01_bin.19]